MFMSHDPIPDGMFQIPSDTPIEQLPHYGAQFAIQAVMLSLGSREIEPGMTGISTDLLMQSLSMAVAMMIAADTRNPTPRDVRLDSEKWGKIIAGYAKILREENDLTARDLMELMGLQSRNITPN